MIASAKILVTGATGNVGSATIKHLLAHGEQVVAAVTDVEQARAVLPADVEFVKFDFLAPGTYEPALAGVDRVFLMRPPQLGKPEDLAPFVDTMKSHGIRLVAFLSLMGVENNPVPPHHKIEKLIEQAGLPYAHIRPSFFMQNISGVHAQEIVERDEIFIPAGRSKTSFIDTDNIGEAAATVLCAPDNYQNTAYTITGPEALDYYQIADILSRVLGRSIRYANPGFLKYRHHYIHHRGLPAAYVNVTVMLYLMTRLGAAKHVTDEYEKLTGHKPTSFEDFARAHIDNFRKSVE
jgi:uncharacterized protein YbjT (DUF2867 family)